MPNTKPTVQLKLWTGAIVPTTPETVGADARKALSGWMNPGDRVSLVELSGRVFHYVSSYGELTDAFAEVITMPVAPELTVHAETNGPLTHLSAWGGRGAVCQDQKERLGVEVEGPPTCPKCRVVYDR
jgi:hypothetical protein